MNYLYGSFWRKWDLHVHTIESKLNNQFGDNWDKYIYELFTRAINNEIYAIGITDYFLIDGYKKVKEYIDDEIKLNNIFKKELEVDSNYVKKVKSILILPNIEFRLGNTVNIQGKVNSKLQIHIIFDDKLDIEDIEENFLYKLKILSDVNPGNIGTLTLTKRNIEQLGVKLKREQADGYGELSDYVAGLKGTFINFNDIIEALSDTKFNNRYIMLAVEEDITSINWKDQCHMIKKQIYGFCDGLFSSNKKTIIWGLKVDTKNEFGSYKPCIWGSDAHSYEGMFITNNNNCWIKADTTFEGLKQVFLIPSERVYIGNTCPQLDVITKRSPYIIKKIEIHKKINAKNQKTMFNTNLYLNPYMITIIGNKGSGKSALSDIIAYICNSKNINNASFLNPNRFQKADFRYADDYSANLEWFNNQYNSVDTLQNVNNNNSVELVQYLPQKYIETICNELGDEFQKEIDKVIFSYIDVANKHKYNNLEELITDKSSIYITKLQTLRNNLEDFNNSIMLLEDKSMNSYKLSIENNLAYQLKRLINHESNKPVVVEKPDNQSEPIYASLAIKIASRILDIEKEILNNENQIGTINSELDLIKDINMQKNHIVDSINTLNSKYKEFLVTLRIPAADFIKIEINDKNLIEKEMLLLIEKKEITELLDETEVFMGVINPDLSIEIIEEKIIDYINQFRSLYTKKYVLEKIKEFVSSKTDIETQMYHKYLDDMKQWEETKREIIGEKKSNASIKYYQDEIDYLNSKLKIDLNQKCDERIKIIESIYQVYIDQADIYKEIYRPIEEKLKMVLKDIDELVIFDVNINHISSFKKDILSYIDQRAAGFFQGVSKGNIALDNLIKQTNFYEKESIINFIQSIYNATNEESENIKSILGDKRGQYNDFIGSLKYLKINYVLKLGNKSLEQLSPGERGVVLLIFYLALNKNNTPLIIDQPEDNLDNQSVYSKLVPCILEAKKNRQLIMVTHNPNIAIACDSEQIIFCNMDKQSDLISYESGSVENLNIKKRVVDILEGTEPAFDLRKNKYNI
jgi:ABC-type lipoprotein export system ATPase subunit